MFTGDIVYTERMLSVRPYSDSQAWIHSLRDNGSFRSGKYIVPGHGHVTTLEKARKDTYSNGT